MIVAVIYRLITSLLVFYTLGRCFMFGRFIVSFMKSFIVIFIMASILVFVKVFIVFFIFSFLPVFQFVFSLVIFLFKFEDFAFGLLIIILLFIVV